MHSNNNSPVEDKVDVVPVENTVPIEEKINNEMNSNNKISNMNMVLELVKFGIMNCKCIIENDMIRDGDIII